MSGEKAVERQGSGIWLAEKRRRAHEALDEEATARRHLKSVMGPPLPGRFTRKEELARDVLDLAARIEQLEATAAAYREALERIAEGEDVDMNGEYVMKDQPKLSAVAAKLTARAALTTDARSSEGVDGRDERIADLEAALGGFLMYGRWASIGSVNNVYEVRVSREHVEAARALLADVPAEED